MKARGTHSLPKQESLVRELHRTPTVVEELGVHGASPGPCIQPDVAYVRLRPALLALGGLVPFQPILANRPQVFC